MTHWGLRGGTVHSHFTSSSFTLFLCICQDVPSCFSFRRSLYLRHPGAQLLHCLLWAKHTQIMFHGQMNDRGGRTFWQPLIHVKRRQRLGVYLRHRINIITKIKGLWCKYLYYYSTHNTKNNTHTLKGSVHHYDKQKKKQKKKSHFPLWYLDVFIFYFSRLWNFSFHPNIIKVKGILFVLLTN